MPSIEVGRVCVKIAGRDAGKYCIITQLINENFVEISGPKKLSGVKRKRVNIAHLEPTSYILEIKERATDESLEKAIEKAGLKERFNEGIKFK